MPSVRALGGVATLVAILGCGSPSDKPAVASTNSDSGAAPAVTTATPVSSSTPSVASSPVATAKSVMVSGPGVFATTCATCHQLNGEGIPDKYPPLAGSEWVSGSDERMLRIVIGGLTGDVEVQGETFSGVMPGWGPTLSDAEIAAVVTYVRSQFGNGASPVDTTLVARVRAATASRTTPWTVAELKKPPL
jgi:mono/diheme cytochrome c family protein